MRRSPHAVSAALLLIGMAAPPLVACGAGAADSVPKTPIVETMLVPQAGQAGGAAGASYTGVVQARIASDLGFRVDGKIAQRLVDAGQSVSRGQILMRLDPADLGLAAAAARERQRAAEAEAGRTAADVTRLEGLVEAGAVSAATYDAAVAAQRVAAATLEAARSAAREAANRQGYAVLVADSDAIVADVLAQPGQVVPAGTPVIRLGRAGAREAMIAIPETAKATLPRMATATLYGSNTIMPARLREVAGAADPLTRTFAARYVLGGAGAAAPLGSTVTIIVPATARGGFARPDVLPQSALHEAGAGPGVWAVGRDGRVRLRRVRLAGFADEAVVLAPGALRAGERIVVLGAHLLHEGDPVRVASVGGSKPA
jgi:RND family efflux transporter MFP subunit